jgi:hypothetical protein
MFPPGATSSFHAHLELYLPFFFCLMQLSLVLFECYGCSISSLFSMAAVILCLCFVPCSIHFFLWLKNLTQITSACENACARVSAGAFFSVIARAAT